MDKFIYVWHGLQSVCKVIYFDHDYGWEMVHEFGNWMLNQGLKMANGLKMENGLCGPKDAPFVGPI